MTTPERLKRAAGLVEGVNTDTQSNARFKNTIRMLDGHPLELLSSQHKITGDQYVAGCQYHADWYHAGLGSNGVIDPSKERVDGGQRSDGPLNRLEYLDAFNAAVRILPLAHAHILNAVILNEEKISDFGERVYGKLYRSVDYRVTATVTHLRLALDCLCDHYMGRRRQQRSAWQEPGTRPTIGGGHLDST